MICTPDCQIIYATLKLALSDPERLFELMQSRPPNRNELKYLTLQLHTAVEYIGDQGAKLAAALQHQPWPKLATEWTAPGQGDTPQKLLKVFGPAIPPKWMRHLPGCLQSATRTNLVCNEDLPLQPKDHERYRDCQIGP